MSGRYLLTLDVGTSGGRCVIFGVRGRLVALKSRPWSYLTAGEISPLAREFDPHILWSTLCQLVSEALKSKALSPREIAAVSVTSQRQGVVFLDKEGVELYAGPNLDLRAVSEGATIDERLGSKVYEITGHLPSFFFAPAKLRWFQVHQPDIYSRVVRVLTLADWVIWKMTGILVSEATLAGEAGLLDLKLRSWCNGLLEEIGLSPIEEVPIGQAGKVVGSLSGFAASRCGIREGTPVVLAGADTQCGLLGMGVVREGEVGIVAGWSVPLQMVTLHPILSSETKTWAGLYLLPQLWVCESNAGDMGNTYQWVNGLLFGSRRDGFSRMERLIEKVPPGSEGTLAILGQSKMDMGKLGMREGGFIFPVPLTFSPVKKGHVARAALESFAYTIRSNLHQLEEVSGQRAKSISIGGGMTKSQACIRILADVLGREIRVSPIPQVSALGGALCAATGAGFYSSLEEAASTRRLKVVEPDPAATIEYEDCYNRWMDASRALEEMRP